MANTRQIASEEVSVNNAVQAVAGLEGTASPTVAAHLANARGHLIQAVRDLAKAIRDSADDI